MRRHILILFFFIPILVFGQKEKLRPEKLWSLGRLSDVQVSPDGKKILFGVTTYDIKENKSNRSLYIQNINSKEKTKLNITTSAYNARWHPDGQKIAYLSYESSSMQLWEINTDGTEKRQVTKLDNDISNFAYSPDGKYISFTMNIKLDATIHDTYPDLPKANARVIDDLMYRHWDTWHDYAYSHVFYASYKNGEVGEAKDIMEGEHYDSPLNPFGGTEHITWSPDGQKIAYVSKKLRGKDAAQSTNADIYIYNIKSGKTTNLTEGMMGYDTNPLFSSDGQKIAWLSMKKDGFEADKNVIYYYDFEKKKKSELTEKEDLSIAHFCWDKHDKQIYFIAGEKATYQIYNLKLASNQVKPLTQGIHDITSVAIADDKLVSTKMTMSQPTEIFLFDKKTGKQEQLTEINTAALNKLTLGTVKKRMVKTTDGKEMLVWVIYPPNFDSKKKYPTLLYCQGGPQSAVSQFFSYRWNFQLMAAQGYIIVAPNRRGLPTFGQEWNDQISKDWGGQAIEDYLSAIDDVSKESYVDQERLGAVGASYGGYSVYFLAGKHKKRFKVFIAHCGLFNLESWYGSTEELFFANWDIGGPYWKKPLPKSYTDFSPHKFVQNWDTPILVIHNEKDFRVPINQGMEAFTAAQLQNIPSRFLYFPEENHWVLSPQNGILWQRIFFDWLERYIGDKKENEKQ